MRIILWVEARVLVVLVLEKRDMRDVRCNGPLVYARHQHSRRVKGHTDYTVGVFRGHEHAQSTHSSNVEASRSEGQSSKSVSLIGGFRVQGKLVCLTNTSYINSMIFWKPRIEYLLAPNGGL